MVHLNVYACHRVDDKLKIWNWPSSEKDEPIEVNKKYSCVTTDLKSTPAVAVPTNMEGIIVLDDRTDYELTEVAWRNYPWLYTRLIHYSTIRHLVENHSFEPLQVDQNRAKTNRVNEVYRTDPLSEPVDGLEIRAGLKVRVRFWDLPKQDPFVGVNFAYTTTNYFTDPLNEVLSGVDSVDYWLKMKCPSDCTHTECTFHGQDGLVGKFDGFEEEGEACRYNGVSSNRYVALSPSVEGVDSNPPVQQLSIEPSYPNIRQWAVEKYGGSKDEIVGKIERERLGIPDHISDSDATDKRYFFEQNRLAELVEDVDKKVGLPLGQSVNIASDPIEIIT